MELKKGAGALPALISILSCTAWAQASTDQTPTDDVLPAGPDRQATNGSQSAAGDKVIIKGKRWLFNRETRYAHSLPEVDGPAITVTKKTSVVKLDEQPSVIDNNQREIFDRLPGIVLAEQQNPTQLNLTYRGLGNPQESEFILVMQDGIPLELDWIGYPTLYYLPVPQTLSSVQMIRAGSGLLYGPEPQPVINFISQAPATDRQLGGTTQQVGGSDRLFSSFNSISGTVGALDYVADYSHRQSSGQRANGDYTVNAGDLTLGYRIDGGQKLTLAIHAYSVDSGLAGLYYDVSLFQVNVRDRIEARQLTQTETVDVNTGNSRSRGAELESTYDLLRLWGASPADQHLTVFANASLLNARFTSSALANQAGKTPAYAPDYVLKAGATLRRDGRYKLSMVVDSVASQFFQDSDLPIASTPARIPAYTVLDFSGEYTVAARLSVLVGISNLTDRRYYSRVFIARGQLEPGRDRTFYGGLAYDF